MARPPQPYDLVLGGYAWKLARDGRGQLQFRRKPAPFFAPRISSGAASQASFPPDRRLPYTFGQFGGGFGQARQTGNDETDRYWYAAGTGSNTDEGCDASLGDRVILGPRISRLTLPGGFIPSTGYFFQFGTALYVAATNEVDTRVFKFDRSAAAWDLQATVSGRAVTDAIVFRGTRSTDYIYLAMGSGAAIKYSTDGATWTDIGGTAFRAEKLTVIDGELWRFISSSTSSDVSKCTDGGSSPTFGGTATTGTITVGDYNGTCNGLYNHADRLVIGKTNGLFVLAADRATLDQNLEADLRAIPDTGAFTGGTVWRGQLIAPFGLTLVAYNADYRHAEIGWDQLRENDSAVWGRPHSIVADRYDLWSVSRSGHLMKGAVTHSGDGSIESVAWHPVSYLGETDRNMVVWGGGLPELHIVMAAGVIGRMILSSTGNPLTDTRYRYCSAGAIYWPRFYGGFTAVDKLTFSVTLDADGLSAGQTAQFGYRLSHETGYTDLAATQTISPGDRNDLPVPLQARAIDLRAMLTTDDPTRTPMLRSATIDFLVQPDPVPTLEMVIDCTQGAALVDGSRQTLEPSVAAQRLYDMVNAGVKPSIDPWGRSLDVTIPLDGMEEVAGADHGPTQEPDLLVRIVAQGQRQRPDGTFDHLAQFTFEQLATYTFDQLVQL